MLTDLDALLAPLGAERFFAEFFERRPLHLATAGAAPPPLLTHDRLLEALSPGRAARSIPAGIVVFPEHAGATAEELFADPARLAAYLEEGHPLVWNRARGVSDEVDAITALLSDALGAHVWPNVYATGEAGTPFDMHFDAHEVFAIQCEGDKDWQISDVRVDRPLDAAEMEPAITAALGARRDEAAARILASFTARPGDLVYLPRGQFHNAKAARGRSLHVTFGARAPSGFDVARALTLDLLADPAFREYLPPRGADPDGAREREALSDLADRLSRALRDGALASAAGALRAAWTRRSV